MKTLITITLLLLSTQLKANDSTARAHLEKAKNNLIIGGVASGIGLVCIYQGIYNQDNATTTLGVVALGIGSVTTTIAAWHYNAAHIEVNAGIKSVGLRIKF